MSINESPRFISAVEAARRLGIMKSTVYDWIAKGSFPLHRFGRTIRIQTSDLEDFIARTRMNTLAGMKKFEARHSLGMYPAMDEDLWT